MIQKIRNSRGDLLDITHYYALDDSHSRANGVIIILAHHSAHQTANSTTEHLATDLSRDGWQCLLINYATTSLATSSLTENTADLTSIIDQIGHGKKIIHIGHGLASSIGTLTAVRDERISGLVSLAGLVHTQEFAKQSTTLPKKLIKNLSEVQSILPAAKELRLPWLLFHGIKDEIIPPENSKDLTRIYRGKNKLVSLPDGDHLLEKDSSIIAKETLTWLYKYF